MFSFHLTEFLITALPLIIDVNLGKSQPAWASVKEKVLPMKEKYHW